MRIAFCRYNLNVDLDFSIASVGSRNSDERLGILEALIEMGHNVTIVSWVPIKHRHALKGESKGNYDNSWMTSMKWDIWADMQQFDLFLVETATTTTNFYFRHEGEVIYYINHFAELLLEAKGLPVLIYHHGNRGLSFPFVRLSKPQMDVKLESLDPLNYHNIFRDIDIWNNDFTIWHKAHTSMSFLKEYSIQYYRSDMDLDKVKFVRTPIGYSSRYDKEHPTIDPTKTEFDLCYVGRNDRGTQASGGRPARIHKFYDSELYSSLLVGKGWELEGYAGNNKKLMLRYGSFSWKHSITTPGKTRNHGDVFDHYRRAKASIQILPHAMAYSGMATSRHQQAIMAGAVCFVAEDIVGGSDWVGDEDFVVSDAEDVAEALEYYCDTLKHQKDANDYQRSKLHKWLDIIVRPLNVAVGKEEPDDVSSAKVYKDIKVREF